MNTMKYSRLRLLLLFCLVIACLLPVLSSYGWQSATQAAQDEQRLRKESAVARKKMVQQLMAERRRVEPSAPTGRASSDGTPAAPTGPCDPGPSILLNQTLSGQLTTGDCTIRIGDNTYADIYTYSFSGSAGQLVAISLNSTAFDAYLYLCYSDGTIITQDDDGGGGTNARIPTGNGLFTLPATGTYWIVANALFVGQTGAYQLSLTDGGLMYYPLPAPVRLLDTRGRLISPEACTVNNVNDYAHGQSLVGGVHPGGDPTILQQGRGICTIPTNAVAITGNLIPVPVNPVDPGWGFLTLWPSDATKPIIATTNHGTNEIINNVFTVGIGADHNFKIYSHLNTHVVVDVTGYYAPPTTDGLYFHTLPKPVRLLETQETQVGCYNTSAQLPTGILGGTSLTQQAWGTCDGATIPNAARAIVGNATSISAVTSTSGFLTLWPADKIKPQYVASTNYNGGGDIVNTPFTTGLSPEGEFKIFAHTTTDVTIDVVGYYSTEAFDVNGAGLLFKPLAHPVRLLETRPGLPVGCFKPGAEYVGGQEYTQVARGTCDGLNIPNDAMAITGNATVVFPGPSPGPSGLQSSGALTLWRNGLTRPASPDRTASNYLQGGILNRYFTVALGETDGIFRIYSTATTHLVIDVVGYFAP
jgi:hypothetical protein